MGCSASKPEEVVVTVESGKFDRTQHPTRAARTGATIVNNSDHNNSSHGKRKNTLGLPINNSVMTILSEHESGDNLAQLNSKHWKFYHEFDSVSGDGIVVLKRFMKSLLAATLPETYPGKGKERSKEATTLVHTTLSHVDVRAFGGCKTSKFNAAEYDSHFKPSLFEEVFEVYRRAGKLSTATVTRILKRAFICFQKVEVLMRITVPTDGKLVIVGDLHGNIVDLLRIIEECGVPSANNMYIFNGDFVDRGKFSVEVMTLLLTIYVCYPDYVILNRGNHEEGPMTQVYGFEKECLEKYDELTYGMYVELFKYMPVFILVNDFVFVLHGGLFNNREVKIADLEKIDRLTFVGEPAVPYPECLEGLDAEGQWREYQHQLMRDALWSDPIATPGMEPSVRGTGVHFGPDIAKEFMDNNNLTMIVRSHECCQRGFYLPYSETANPALNKKGYPLLCTIFSSSNYGGRLARGGENEGAYMVFMNHPHPTSQPVPSTKLFYSVHHFRHNRVGLGVDPSKPANSFGELMLRHQKALSNAFEVFDVKNCGEVTRDEFATVMTMVTRIHMCWRDVLDRIVPANCFCAGDKVDYRVFQSSYSHRKPIGSTIKLKHANNMFEFYPHHQQLEAFFQFFDPDNLGVISKEKLVAGCKILNENLSEENKFVDEDVERLLELIDFDGLGVIGLNEFFEAHRITAFLPEDGEPTVSEPSTPLSLSVSTSAVDLAERAAEPTESTTTTTTA